MYEPFFVRLQMFMAAQLKCFPVVGKMAGVEATRLTGEIDYHILKLF